MISRNFANAYLPLATLQSCKAKSIQSAYLRQSPTSQKLRFKHNGILVDLDMTMAELNTFGDNIIAMEIVRQPDILTDNGSTPAQELESPIESKSSNRETDKENTSSLFRPLPNLTGSDLRSDVVSANQSISPSVEASGSQQGFLMECAMRDFMHQGLAELCHCGHIAKTTTGKTTPVHINTHSVLDTNT